MPCAQCDPSNQWEFPSEINIHSRNIKKLHEPTLLVFPTLVVCLDCGSARFAIPETELRLLRERTKSSGVV